MKNKPHGNLKFEERKKKMNINIFSKDEYQRLSKRGTRKHFLFNMHTNSDNVSPITSTRLVGGKNITLSLISIQYRINYVFLFYLLYFCICCIHWNSKHVGRISVRQLIPCPVLHIIQQIVTHLWELILYAII